MTKSGELLESCGKDTVASPLGLKTVLQGRQRLAQLCSWTTSLAGGAGSGFHLNHKTPQQLHPSGRTPPDSRHPTGTVSELRSKSRPAQPHTPRASALPFCSLFLSHISHFWKAVTATLQSHVTGLERITLLPTRFSLGGCFSVSLAKQKNSNTCTN